MVCVCVCWPQPERTERMSRNCEMLKRCPSASGKRRQKASAEGGLRPRFNGRRSPRYQEQGARNAPNERQTRPTGPGPVGSPNLWKCFFMGCTINYIAGQEGPPERTLWFWFLVLFFFVPLFLFCLPTSNHVPVSEPDW